MKQITLWKQNGRPSGLFALVDDKNFDWLGKFNWYVARRKHTNYAAAFINGAEIFMHNLILPTHSSELEPDHKNNNGLDNQEENLRLGTRSQNLANKRSNTNTSGYRGVSWDKVNKQWEANVSCKGIKYRVGRFNTKEAAARAYNNKAFELFGEFAKLNEVI